MVRHHTVLLRIIRHRTVAVVTDRFFESRPEHMPLGKLVSWAGGAMQAHYRRTVARYGVTGTAVSVLGVLAHTDGALSQRELAGRVGLTPATLTPVLDALDHEGRITRVRDDADRRILRVSITDEGRTHLRSVFSEVAAVFREQMPHPPPEHERIIREYLVSILTVVGDDARYAGDGGGITEGAGR
jgi:MarR family transcriptional regulator, organic hydroperoxide resistance regulator